MNDVMKLMKPFVLATDIGFLSYWGVSLLILAGIAGERVFLRSAPASSVAFHQMVARAVEALAAERLGSKGVYPNVDFYSGIVYDKMGIDSDLFTPIFAIARTAGWLSHWLEQLQDNRIFRPSQVFVGDSIFGTEPGVRTTIAAAGGIPGNSLVGIDCIAYV